METVCLRGKRADETAPPKGLFRQENARYAIIIGGVVKGTWTAARRRSIDILCEVRKRYLLRHGETAPPDCPPLLLSPESLTPMHRAGLEGLASSSNT